MTSTAGFFAQFVLLTFVLVSSTGTAEPKRMGRAAAICCALGKNCSPVIAKISQECIADVWITRQPKPCRELACSFCLGYPMDQRPLVCKAHTLADKCARFVTVSPTPTVSSSPSASASATQSRSPSASTTPSASALGSPSPSQSRTPSPMPSPSSSVSRTPSVSPTPTTSPSPTSSRTPSPMASTSPSPSVSQSGAYSPSTTPMSTPYWTPIILVSPSAKPAPRLSVSPRSTPTPSTDCTFKGTGDIVDIRMADLASRGEWTRSSGGSLTWKKEVGRGVIKPNAVETICAKFSPAKSGIYYFTARSRASGWTEHNDAWFRLSMPLILSRLVHKQVKRFPAGKFFKGYQNEGPGKWSMYLRTIDHNGHDVLTTPLVSGETYEVCVAGRSTKFTVSDLILVKCSGVEDCNPFRGAVGERLKSRQPSRCL